MTTSETKPAQRPIILHGVLLDINNVGTLLTGSAGIGKSELALDLLSRGHRLVADDAPEFARQEPDTIVGRSPSLLQDFMEVRGLGIVNIRELFGHNAICLNKRLRLIIELRNGKPTDDYKPDRLGVERQCQSILGVQIPHLKLPVTAGRNLAAIIEAAASNQLLLDQGYNAAADFIKRQQTYIGRNTR